MRQNKAHEIVSQTSPKKNLKIVPLTRMLGSSCDCHNFDIKYNTTRITIVTRHTSGDGVKESFIFEQFYMMNDS